VGRDLAVEVVERPGTAWDEMTAEFTDAAYEQTVAYVGKRWGERRLSGIVLRDAGQRAVAAALAVVVELPLVNAGIAWVKFGPLWRRRGGEVLPEVLVQTLLALRQELGERRRLLVRVLPPADPDFAAVWPAALQDAGFVRRRALPDPERYLLDVSLGAEEQLASFGKRWRAELRKAATDLWFEELTGLVAVEEFFRLFRSMLQRKRFDDRHGLETLPALLTHPVAAHRMRVFLAYHGGEPVAASAIGGAGETLHVLFSATSDEALPLRAGYALRWWVLDRLRESGARWLDLGGNEGNRGLRHYKEGAVGKRGRIVPLPGEFDWCSRSLSRLTAETIAVAREILARREFSRLRGGR
jgi:hypothetical protein